MSRHRKSKYRAFTRIELLVIVGILVLLVLVIITGGIRSRQKAMRVRCVSHLMQIGLSFRLWPPAQNADLPMVVSVTSGGTLEVSNEVWRSMLVMSNELGTPRIIACPSDSRNPAPNFATLANSNISYFIGLDTDDSKPDALLAGDRFLSVGRASTNKVLTIQTGDSAVWAGKNHQGGGNMAVADGSVRQYTSAGLQNSITNALRINGNVPLRLAMPE